MDLLVTHDNADFDALGALVAARKLYPEGVMVLGTGGGGAELQAFLAVHRDRFPTVGMGDVDVAAVRRVVLVDVRRAGRLKGYGPLAARLARGDPGLEVHIYDHHPAAPDDLHGAVEVVAPVGSATTLLVETIRERGVAIDALEATLLCLGIHADTGSLTFAGTTARDAAAVTWLLGQGVTVCTGLDMRSRAVQGRGGSAARAARIRARTSAKVVSLTTADPAAPCPPPPSVESTRPTFTQGTRARAMTCTRGSSPP